MNFLNYLIRQLFFYERDPFKFKMYLNADDVIEINKLLNNKVNFYDPNIDMIENYKSAFKIFQKNPNIYSHFFKILQVLPIDSVNGRVFRIGFKNSTREKLDNSELIVKVPLKGGDSLSYEYYVGNVTNILRQLSKTPIFSLIYGRTLCGLNPIFEKIVKDKEGNETFVPIPQHLLDSEKVTICDTGSEKMHLFYEYVRNPNTKRVSSLSSYMKRLQDIDNTDDMFVLERNIINILIILMYSLQVAYNEVQFTHYDLHTGNILVVELDKPEEFEIKNKRGKKISIISNVIPYIIDYGKCFVNPDKAVPEEDGKFHEFETGKIYEKFRDYQNDIFGDWIIDVQDDPKSVLEIDAMIDKYLREISRPWDTKNVIKDRKIFIIDSILNKRETYRMTKDQQRENPERNYFYRNGHLTLKKYDFGINPQPNEKYDFFRLMKTVIYKLYFNVQNNQKISGYVLKYNKLWALLEEQLVVEYPFYDTTYDSLPCDYHITDYNFPNPNPGPWKHWLRKPSDIGKLLYNVVKNDTKIQQDIVLRKHQIGGAVFDVLNKKRKKYIDFDEIISDNMEKQNRSKVSKNYDIDVTDNITIDNSYNDDFAEGVKDVGPMYLKYVESDLMKLINATPTKPTIDRKDRFDINNKQNIRRKK